MVVDPFSLFSAAFLRVLLSGIETETGSCGEGKAAESRGKLMRNLFLKWEKPAIKLSIAAGNLTFVH